jgi:putative chitinase
MSKASFEKALQRLWPLGDQNIPGLRAGIVATAPTVFAKHGITTLLLAQISHECDAGHDVLETVSSAWL